eukprot:1946044-Rhodomonas_salina.3
MEGGLRACWVGWRRMRRIARTEEEGYKRSRHCGSLSRGYEGRRRTLWIRGRGVCEGSRYADTAYARGQDTQIRRMQGVEDTCGYAETHVRLVHLRHVDIGCSTRMCGKQHARPQSNEGEWRARWSPLCHGATNCSSSDCEKEGGGAGAPPQIRDCFEEWVSVLGLAIYTPESQRGRTLRVPFALGRWLLVCDVAVPALGAAGVAEALLLGAKKQHCKQQRQRRHHARPTLHQDVRLDGRDRDKLDTRQGLGDAEPNCKYQSPHWYLNFRSSRLKTCVEHTGRGRQNEKGGGTLAKANGHIVGGRRRRGWNQSLGTKESEDEGKESLARCFFSAATASRKGESVHLRELPRSVGVSLCRVGVHCMALSLDPGSRVKRARAELVGELGWRKRARGRGEKRKQMNGVRDGESGCMSPSSWPLELLGPHFPLLPKS